MTELWRRFIDPEDTSLFADYDNLTYQPQGVPNMFILPEYQQFQHIFKKVDSHIFTRLSSDERLSHAASQLEQAYH